MDNKPLIIAGSGRSGTTWVLDVLAEANNLRTVFEPLNPDGVKGTQNFANQYVAEETENQDLKYFMQRVFNGEINCIWTNTRCLPSKMRPSISKMGTWEYNYTLLAQYKKFYIRYAKFSKKKAFRLITKFIRANLMLDWLAANFDPQMVFMVRHPGAVVSSKITASQAKGGAVWDFYGTNEQRILSQYKNDEKLGKDFLDKYQGIFSEKLSAVAGHTLIWCIENVLPIYNLQKKNKYVFFYEDIINNPEKEFGLMVKILGLERTPDSSLVARPSQQASQEMMSGSMKDKKLQRWMKNFNKEGLAEINTILSFFNVTVYNAFEPEPISRTQDVI